MITRYSSRQSDLGESFLNKKLNNAVNYDRIAGYFCSSILEVAGEALENIEGTVRIICNSSLSKEDVDVAICARKMIQEWHAYEPEEKYNSSGSKLRLERLYFLLKTEKMQVRVVPDEIYGLIHGKAGVVTYKDGSRTAFVGSINETKSAFKLNYEIIWEDDSKEACDWIQEEFDYYWNSPYATPLCDFVIEDVDRLSKRITIPIEDWKKNPNPPVAAAEDPVFKKEFGLWEHQKYFVELAFNEHKTKGGARFVLADQVGLGKTLQLAMSAKLMVLYGDKPILIIVPKTLLFQWQEELVNLLDMPTAVWNGKLWIDENGVEYPLDIQRCPRKVGIISQGLLTRKTQAREDILKGQYECVILDEAHRARRKKLTGDLKKASSAPNNLLDFIQQISFRTKSMLLATATPVQLNVIEAYDLVEALGRPNEAAKVIGTGNSQWRQKPIDMLELVCGQGNTPDSALTKWDIMRNPLPKKNFGGIELTKLRDALDLNEDEVVVTEGFYEYSKPNQNKIINLFDNEDFIRNYNPYIRHIVRRTRDFLENTVNPSTGMTYLQKINVKLYGEDDNEAIRLSGPSRQAYEAAEEFCSLLSKRVKAGGFIKTLLLKRIGSTINAGDSTAKKMLSWTEEGKEILSNDFNILFDEDDEYEEDESEIKKLTDEELAILKRVVSLLSHNKDDDPKYDCLYEILTEGVKNDPTPWMQKGCIIFSQYFDSAYFIAERLSKDLHGEKIGLYAGSEKSGLFLDGIFEKKPKEEIKAMVKRRELKILMGTDAASEGLNLQTLSTLINLDLPWNPTRLEQRKGRIQRIGQESDTIYIYNMRYKDSVEDKVHKVLSERLNGIFSIFGQIPDTLEDVWIDVAEGNIEKAKDRIDLVPTKNPFDIKYNDKLPETQNWEACTTILDKDDVKKKLLSGWKE